jgi:nitroalkane oxidase
MACSAPDVGDKGGLHPMAIDFTLTNEQREVQANARDFAENVLAPVVREADAEPDPLRGFQRTKEAYIAAYKAGIAFCMLPREYGGGGLTNVELILAAEEICAVDPGFACTVLVNGLGTPASWSCGPSLRRAARKVCQRSWWTGAPPA